MHKFKGDTLIEVALAVGIFSMVAVSVLAVVNGSTSSAQSALELTVTREEIDAQAEALRFIQSSYLMGGMSNASGFTQEKYSLIWQEITSRALDMGGLDNNDELNTAVLKYNPETCTELYNDDTDNYNSIIKQHAFIINTRNLGAPDKEYTEYDEGINNFIKDHVVIYAEKDSIFQPAATYPRLLYGKEDDALYNKELVDYNTTALRNELFDITNAEGLFIVAVKDNQTSMVVDTDGVTREKSAYYDFYIRSCWFNPGADRPSTISTVIRLQDPAVILYQ